MTMLPLGRPLDSAFPSQVTLKLPRAPACHTEVVVFQGAAVGWGTPSPGAKPLIDNIDLTIKRGQRILVLGPNGAGKSRTSPCCS